MRARLESVWKQTGQRPKELDELVEFPENMQFQWKYFIELNNKRTSSGYGVNPITWSDIYSYFYLNNYRPQEWEISLINKLDEIALKAFAKKQEEEQKKLQKKK